MFFCMEYVAIYNRCSTEEECQVNALAIQAEESVEIVHGKKDWVIVERYIESQSGTSSKNRTEYLKMLEAIENHRFTIVVIKSIDRLARNTKDWYLFLDCIVRNNVRLYIYLDNKFYTPEDSLITGIKAILAEEFSRELSKKIKNAHRRRQEKHSGYNITCEMFGWNKINSNVYEINEEEAVAYRMAFDLAWQGYGFRRISNTMYSFGVRSRSGKKISETQWRKMLRSPRAHGAVVIHSTEYDFETKKRKTVPKEEQIVIENALPSIVTKEYQEKVIEIMDKRAAKCTVTKRCPRNAGKYPLSGKIICGVCGRPYYRCVVKCESGMRIDWKCATYMAEGRKREGLGCDNIKIDESKLYRLIEEKCKLQYDTPKLNMDLVDETMKIFGMIFEKGQIEKEKKRLQQRLYKLKKEKDVLVEKLLYEVISDRDFRNYSERLDREIQTGEIKLANIKEQMNQYVGAESRVSVIRKELIEGNIIDTAKSYHFIRNMQKIIVHQDGELNVFLNERCTFYTNYEYSYKDESIKDKSKRIHN